MLIILEYNGTSLHQIASEDMSEDILIGRSKECFWRVPGDDISVGRQHVRLKRHGKRVFLTDLGSKNGTYCKGKRIKKSLHLKPGLQISFGNCVLTVAASEASARPGIAPWIAIASGRLRGQKRPIADTMFTIGSDTDASLVLLDDLLISREHAEIVKKGDGSCWIKDLKSTNGTKVNDVPLRGDKERLLQDGDRIDVAHLELRFHDGRSATFDWRVWLRLGAMGLTFMVAVGLYYGYRTFWRPSATAYVAESRALAAERRFDDAREMLAKADNSKGIQDRQLEVSDLRRLLSLWQSTVDHWSDAQVSLQTGDWITASRHLAGLNARSQDGWTWDLDGDGLDVRNAAMQAKKLLDVFLTASSAMGREDVDHEYLLDLHRTLIDVGTSFPTPTPPYLEKLTVDFRHCLAKLSVMVADYGAIDAALESLASWSPPPPLDQSIRTVQEIGDRAGGAVKNRAELLIAPLGELKIGMEDLGRTIVLVHDLRFEEALSAKPQIPSASLCALHPRLSQLRENLLNASLNLKTQTQTVANLFDRIQRTMDDACSGFSLRWQEDTVSVSVLNCDSLDSPFPKSGRSEPAGEYDRYLGVDEFFEFLRSGQDASGVNLRPERAFRPLLSSTEQVVRSIEALGRYLGEKENAWLLQGRLRQRFSEMGNILIERDRIVDVMLKEVEGNEERRSIIAAGIALRLSEDPDGLTAFDRSLKAWLQAEFTRFRTELLKLNSQYDYASPEAQIRIRDEILNRGLPGDPIVKRMWIRKSAAQAL